MIPIRLTVTAAALAAAVTACSGPTGGNASEPFSQGTDRSSAQAVSARVLADRASISDGSVGYLADTPLSPASSPWSLNATYWNAIWLNVEGRESGLDANALFAWAHSSLVGKLDGSALPPVQQILFGAELARTLEVKIDPAASEEALSSAQTKTGYSYDLDAGKATPGATAIVAHALAVLGEEMPTSVKGSLSAELLRTSRSARPLNGQAVSSRLVPLIEALSYTDLSQGDRQLVARLAARAQKFLDSTRLDVVLYGADATLHGALRRLDVPTPEVNPTLCRAPLFDGLLPAQQSFFKWQLGCASASGQIPASPSPSGWVDLTKTTGNGSLLASTRAGLTLLADQSRARSATLARAWVTQRWGSRLGNPFDEYERVRLRQAVDLPAAPTRLRVVSASRLSPTSSLVALLQADLSGRSDRRNRSAARLRPYMGLLASAAQDRRFSAFDAAALYAGGRTFGDRRWQAQARAAMRRLRLPDGTYTLMRGGDVSIESSALGAWVADRTISLKGLVQRRFCDRQSVCSKQPSRASPSPEASLAATATVAVCKHRGCRGQMPLFFS